MRTTGNIVLEDAVSIEILDIKYKKGVKQVQVKLKVADTPPEVKWLRKYDALKLNVELNLQ